MITVRIYWYDAQNRMEIMEFNSIAAFLDFIVVSGPFTISKRTGDLMELRRMS